MRLRAALLLSCTLLILAWQVSDAQAQASSSADAPGNRLPAPENTTPEEVIGADSPTPSLTAPPPPAAVQASTHFKHGLELFAQDAHAAALLEFRRAHELAPDFHVRFNIAQCLVLLGRYPEALRSFELYLEEGGSQETSGRAKLVEAQLEALRKRLGKLAIEVNLEGSEIFVDDKRIGESPLPTTVPMEAGKHRVFVRAPGQSGESRVVEVPPGDLLEVRFDLLTAPIVEEPVETAPVDPSESDHRVFLRRSMIGTMAAAGAALTGAVVAGLAASDARDALDRELEQLPADEPAIAQSEAMFKRQVKLSDSLFIGSVALGITAAACWWSLHSSETETAEDSNAASLEISVGPGGLLAHGRFP